VVIAKLCTSGQNPQGLPGSFVAAGAIACIASLWPIEDVSSGQFGRIFTEVMIHGGSLGASFQAAKPSGSFWRSYASAVPRLFPRSHGSKRRGRSPIHH
jgi:hypothetical protein